jgi:drug/metabolite transporter (DMT)-like permease
MARGLATLWYKRSLLNPFRFGMFAVMLASHKLARWLVYAALPVGVIGLVLLAPAHRAAAIALAAGVAGAAVGVVGRRWPRESAPPRLVALAAFAWASALAGVVAWRDALAGRRRAVWEPTRRPTGAGAPVESRTTES